ncbi:MAG: hypothetical protein HKN14_01635 [Marinicaulis sp.]|nr:hypothetical protein [Marinicaulis sp.]NNE39599.1 hypothetical protein [Marinicaulis sp.]NNL88032.1 hypothetical protein [Marinicaulis sp.]
MKPTILIIFGSVAIVAAVFSAAILEGSVNAHQNEILKSRGEVAQAQ